MAKSGERLTFVGPGDIAAAVARVQFAVGVEEEDGEGEVVIEIEDVEVEGVDVGKPNEDELVGDFADLLETDNLPVEGSAVRSGLTA